MVLSQSASPGWATRPWWSGGRGAPTASVPACDSPTTSTRIGSGTRARPRAAAGPAPSTASEPTAASTASRDARRRIIVQRFVVPPAVGRRRARRGGRPARRGRRTTAPRWRGGCRPRPTGAPARARTRARPRARCTSTSTHSVGHERAHPQGVVEAAAGDELPQRLTHAEGHVVAEDGERPRRHLEHVGHARPQRRCARRRRRRRTRRSRARWRGASRGAARASRRRWRPGGGAAGTSSGGSTAGHGGPLARPRHVPRPQRGVDGEHLPVTDVCDRPRLGGPVAGDGDRDVDVHDLRRLCVREVLRRRPHRPAARWCAPSASMAAPRPQPPNRNRSSVQMPGTTRGTTAAGCASRAARGTRWRPPRAMVGRRSAADPVAWADDAVTIIAEDTTTVDAHIEGERVLVSASTR